MSAHSYHHDNNEYPYVVKGYAANSMHPHVDDQSEMEILRGVKHKTTQQLSDQMSCVLNVVNLNNNNEKGGDAGGNTSSRMNTNRSNGSSSMDSSRTTRH